MKKKEQEYEECRLQLSKVEKAHEEKCTKLQKEIEDLQKKAEDDKKHLEREKMLLEVKLTETKSALREAERLQKTKNIEILQQKNEILIAECKIKDDRLLKLEEELREKEHDRALKDMERLKILEERERLKILEDRERLKILEDRERLKMLEEHLRKSEDMELLRKSEDKECQGYFSNIT